MKINLPLNGGSYQHPSQPTNNQRCINQFLTATGPLGWGSTNNPPQGTLLPTMGALSLQDLAVTVGDQIRGIKYIQGNLYVVCGVTVYKIFYDDINLAITATIIGTLNANTNKPVIISANPTQVIFVDSSASGYLYTISTNTFAKIADPDFLGGSHVIYIDSYFIYNAYNTNKFFFSGVDDGTAWNPLDFASLQSKPDIIVGLASAKGDLWVFGQQSITVWKDDGNPSPGSPFTKINGSDISVGCSAPYSIQAVNDVIIWLDSRGFITQSAVSSLLRDQSSGYTLTKISTDAIDAEINSYRSTANAVASTYVYRGHVMYEITFPSANKTWVYDTSTQLWHQRSYRDVVNSQDSYSLGQFYEMVNGVVIGGGLRSGKLYTFGKQFLTDDSVVIRRLLSTPFVHEMFKEIDIGEIELKGSTGNVIPSWTQTTTTSNTNNTTVFSTTVASSTSGSIINNTIKNITDYTGNYSSYVRTIATTIYPNVLGIWINSNHASTMQVGDSIAVRKNNYVWIFGYIQTIGQYAPPDAVTLPSGLQDSTYLTITFPTNTNTFVNNPASGDYVGYGNPVIYQLNSISLTLTSSIFYYEVGDIMTISLVNGETRDSVIVFTNFAMNNVTVLIDPSYAWTPADSNYTAEGYNTKTNIGIAALQTITLTDSPPALFPDDIINITLDNGTIFTTKLLTVDGNIITFDGAITTPEFTAGNPISFLRPTTTPATTRSSVTTSDPYIQLRYSQDGGYTWSYGMIRPMGKIGEFNKRMSWNSLGSCREWVFEFLITDIVDYSIIDATMDIMVETG